MVSSNGTEATINFFLAAVRARNPTVIPALFMSDFAWEQLNSITARYPESTAAFVLVARPPCMAAAFYSGSLP
jgi:hypothetical protein